MREMPIDEFCQQIIDDRLIKKFYWADNLKLLVNNYLASSNYKLY